MCIAKKRPISDPCFLYIKRLYPQSWASVASRSGFWAVWAPFSALKRCVTAFAPLMYFTSLMWFQFYSLLSSSVYRSFLLYLSSTSPIILNIYVQWNSMDMLFNAHLFLDFIGSNPSMILPPLTIFSPSDYLVMHPRGQDPRQRRMPKSPITPKHPAIHAAYTRALFPRAGGGRHCRVLPRFFPLRKSST